MLDVAQAVGPLHATDPSSAFLQIAARADVSRDDIRRALYEERLLLRHTTLPRTVHLLTPTLAVAAHGSYNHRLVPALRAQLLKWIAASEDVDGPPEPWLAELEDAVVAAVEPTVWWDGRIVGGWTQRDDGSVVTELLDEIPAEAAAAVAAEAERLRTWLGEVRVRWRYPTPLQKALR